MRTGESTPSGLQRSSRFRVGTIPRKCPQFAETALCFETCLVLLKSVDDRTAAYQSASPVSSPRHSTCAKLRQPSVSPHTKED